MSIYLDNAATTNISEEVLEEMLFVSKNIYGNPSSIHQEGIKAKTYIEKCRKSIARILDCAPSEICFTSGGTEANNMAIYSGLELSKSKTIITTKLEHHAVLNSVEYFWNKPNHKIIYLKTNHLGHISLEELEETLKENQNSFVSLMHANNEIGTMHPIKKIAKLCETNNCIFHSDTVQTIGNLEIKPHHYNLDFAISSAHKFNGPKGVGFLFINKRNKIHPFINGGAQERGLRGGTENIIGIAGLTKAFEINHNQIQEKIRIISNLKTYAINEFEKNIKGIGFNGDYDDKSLYSILNVLLPQSPNAEMLLMNLDMEGICVSSGSACTSGSKKSSHVLEELGVNPLLPSIRISFNSNNTNQEIDHLIKTLKRVL